MFILNSSISALFRSDPFDHLRITKEFPHYFIDEVDMWKIVTLSKKMKSFIAYFDYLGFKEFIENNDLEYQIFIMHNIFRDIEMALGQGKFKSARHGEIADLSNSRINCINFSDTVVFWTNDESEESLRELLSVTHTFNWMAIDFSFPVRGALVYDELYYVLFSQSNNGGGHYNINSVFGKGLVHAHLKAESQNWAGTVIDQSLIQELQRRDINPVDYLKPFAKKYKVPYKSKIELPEEFVYCIITGVLNDDALKNYGNGIRKNFTDHRKSIENPGAKEKLDNTLNFLESFYKAPVQ